MVAMQLNHRSDLKALYVTAALEKGSNHTPRQC